MKTSLDASRKRLLNLFIHAHCNVAAIKYYKSNIKKYEDDYADILWNISEELEIPYEKNDKFVLTCNKFFGVYQPPSLVS